MAPTIAASRSGSRPSFQGAVAACFEAVNHQVENGACLGGIARELDRAVRVGDRIVPRRHRAGRIGVPRRRNVRMRPVEDRDRFRAGGDLRVRIGAGEMAEQRAVRLAVGNMQQRQVRHQRLGRVRRDQRRERVVVNQPRDRRAIARREVFRDVEAHLRVRPGAVTGATDGRHPAAHRRRRRAARTARAHRRQRSCSDGCRTRRSRRPFPARPVCSRFRRGRAS